MIKNESNVLLMLWARSEVKSVVNLKVNRNDKFNVDGFALLPARYPFWEARNYLQGCFVYFWINAFCDCRNYDVPLLRDHERNEYPSLNTLFSRVFRISQCSLNVCQEGIKTPDIFWLVIYESIRL